MDLKIGDLATFDNPDNPYARWGKVLKIEDGKVVLSYVGWGLVEEVKGVQISLKNIKGGLID